MRGTTKIAGSKLVGSKPRHHSTIHVSPITHAVRAVLAASAMALAGTGVAYADDCAGAEQAQVIRCTTGERADAPVFDLTSVVDDRLPGSVVAAGTTGITASDAPSFTVDIVNRGTIDKSGSGDVIGIDADFDGADISIVNRGSGAIYVESVDGLADGIFTYGDAVTVDNRGTIDADGYTWGAGIEAQGDEVTVNNRGDISASATAYNSETGTYGRAYGIYAASGGDGGIAINNRGSISATGPYATGIYAYDGGTGGIDISNRGDIDATADNGFADGIAAVSSLEGSDIDIDNRGGITASGANGASGIVVTATGLGSSASVDNRGDIYAATTEFYSIAEGIAVSADGDAGIRNRGTITIGYGDYAYGGLALAFAGDADVDNSGAVTVNGGFGADGFVAASQNGETGVTNSGSITVDARFGDAAGIDASSLTGTEVRNDGVISATANKYAFGVLANSSQGDSVVDNRGAITTDGKYSFGVFAQSVDGDALVDNSGLILGSGKYAYGAVAGSTNGDSLISNAQYGSITGYSGDLLAVGAFANAGDGTATIDNAGAITALGITSAQLAYGAVVQTVAGAGLVSNGDTGQIVASNSYGSARGVIVRSSGGGDASLDNRGTIAAIASGTGEYLASDAIGVYVYAPGAAASVDNRGTISAISATGLADGVFASGGTVEVDNSGSITAEGYAWGAGIEAQGDDAAYVTNTGDISASATAYAPADPEAGTEAVYGRAYGIYAVGGDGGVSVDNRGTIAATGVYATGIYAYDASTGGIGIDNRGDIVATADYGIAAGIDAVTTLGDSDIEISNRGSVAATGYNAAYAITGIATGLGSTIGVVNAGDLSAAAADTKYGVAAGVIASGDGEVEVRNTRRGVIDVSGGSGYGLAALAFAGDSDANNAGTVAVSAKYAYGVLSASQNGTANATNSGDVSVVGDGLVSNARGIDATGVDAEVLNRGSIAADGKYSRAISAVASAGDAEVRNTGSVYAGGKYTYGIVGISGDGDVRITNAASGEVDAYSSGALVVGLLGTSTYDDVEIVNAGSVVSRGDAAGLSAGVYASSDNNDVSVVNRGTIDASTYYNAFGVLANIGGDDELGINNRGSIVATSVDYNAVGIDGSSAGGGEVELRNGGSITASSTAGDAIGMAGAVVGGELTLVNSAAGSIDASTVDGDATGMLGVLTDSDVTITNAGSITVASTNGTASAIRIESGAPLTLAGDVAADNQADIADAAAREGVDLQGREGPERILDSGMIQSAIAGVDGKEAAARDAAAPTGTATIINSGSIVAGSKDAPGLAIYGSDGVENIFNRGSMFGAIATNGGDDTMVNQRSGNWTLFGTGSDFGAGDDSFHNARGGTLQLADAGIAFGAGDNSFSNRGIIRVSGANFIDMTDGSDAAAAAALAVPKGTASFTNNGIIDFLDGAADDSLTITGGFGGRGAINLDVSLGSQLNDQLFVQGGVAVGTRQFVNVALLDGLPNSSDVGKQLQLVHVSGGTSPSAFVAGDVLGVSPRDFLTMGMTLSSQPDTSLAAGGSSFMLSVDTFVSGLSATGVLASSAALGVESLMTSTVGSWRDRTYLTTVAGGPAFAGITPWVRGFSSEGGMSPEHLTGNFGDLSNSRLNQDNFGTEMGLELRALNGFRFGTVFAKSEARQYLVEGHGLDTIHGSTMGLYGSWVSPTGLYVDASWRTMRFEAQINSIGGLQRGDGNAVSSNLEVGHTWTLGDGVNIAPQLRYTQTTVDGLRIEGDQATFQGQDAQWKRASAGVSLWKTFGAGGWQWTPYGEVSVMETFQGAASYSINDDYFGNVLTEGTSTLVKFGLGASNGRLSWNGGFNWLDGANFDGALGGQLSLRYAW